MVYMRTSSDIWPGYNGNIEHKGQEAHGRSSHDPNFPNSVFERQKEPISMRDSGLLKLSESIESIDS